MLLGKTKENYCFLHIRNVLIFLIHLYRIYWEMTALSVVGSALKGLLDSGTAKAAGRALLGTADAAGLSK